MQASSQSGALGRMATGAQGDIQAMPVHADLEAGIRWGQGAWVDDLDLSPFPPTQPLDEVMIALIDPDS